MPKKTTTKKRSKDSYIQAIGRRKTATAIVRLFPKDKKRGIVINDKPYNEYFTAASRQKIVIDALAEISAEGKFGIEVLVHGSGLEAQAEAIRHGIARALVELNPIFRTRLKKAGFLTRDPRERERKKPGLKRARRAPQWSKR